MSKKGISVAVVAAGVLAALLLFMNQRPLHSVSFKYDVELGPRPKVKGLDSAPVKVVEFGDFQCPDCPRVAKDLTAQLADLIAAGKVQFTFRHLIVHGLESGWAAEASECAADQGAFWAYHDYLYAHQKGENQGAFSISHLKQFAASIVLDPQEFNSCLDNHSHADAVQADQQEAERSNLHATPSFLINDRLVAFQNVTELLSVIKAAAQ